LPWVIENLLLQTFRLPAFNVKSTLSWTILLRRLQLIQTYTRGEPVLSKNIIKALEVEVLEAITTYSSYTRGEPDLFNNIIKALEATTTIFFDEAQRNRNNNDNYALTTTTTTTTITSVSKVRESTESDLKPNRRCKIQTKIMKALEVEVLEAITTYSSLYSGRARCHLQTQCSNSTSRLEIKQVNSNLGRARPTSYRSIIGTSNSIKQNTFYKLVIGSTSPTYIQHSIYLITVTY
ncbi:hypothetical protein GIB67_024535, partial [Kingdonia uniflora]